MTDLHKALIGVGMLEKEFMITVCELQIKQAVAQNNVQKSGKTLWSSVTESKLKIHHQVSTNLVEGLANTVYQVNTSKEVMLNMRNTRFTESNTLINIFILILYPILEMQD